MAKGAPEARIKLDKEALPEWLKKKTEIWHMQRKERHKIANAAKRVQIADDAASNKKQKTGVGSTRQMTKMMKTRPFFHPKSNSFVTR